MPAYLDEQFFDELDAEINAADQVIWIEWLDGPIGT